MDTFPGVRAAATVGVTTTRAHLRLLLACIGISLPLLAVLVAPQPPLWLDQPIPHPTIDASAPTMGWSGLVLAAGFALFLCLPYHPYGLALRLLSFERVSARVLVCLTAVVAVVGILVYPHFGSDVFDYAAYERLWVRYGENPLSAIVTNHAGDWITPFVNVPDRTPAYGPLWALLTWPIVRLMPDSSLGIVIGYKLLSLAAYALCCWLIWSSVEPARRQRALLLFAWSPLVIFEILGTLHNDVLVAAGLLGMVWLLGRKRTRSAWLTVAAAGLIKATAFAAWPILALRSFRQAGWRGVVLPAASSALVLMLAYLPFWSGPETLSPIWHQTAGLGWSLTTVLTVAISPTGADLASLIIRGLLGVVWAAVLCVLLVCRRADRPTDLAASSGWVLIATVLLLTGAVYGHYFVPIIAMAAVSGESSLERAATGLSIGGLAAHAVGAIGWSLNPLWIGTLNYQIVGAGVLFGPALLVLLVWLRQIVRPMPFLARA